MVDLQIVSLESLFKATPFQVKLIAICKTFQEKPEKWYFLTLKMKLFISKQSARITVTPTRKMKLSSQPSVKRYS